MRFSASCRRDCLLRDNRPGIGLAAPTAQLIGVGLAAKNGILPNGGGEAFQAFSRVDAIVLDKTGTLTTSEFRVSDAELLVEKDEDKALLWSVASVVESASSHPLSVSLRKRCDAEPAISTRIELASSEEIPGRGLAAVVKIAGACYEVLVGNEALMKDRGASYEADEAGSITLITKWQSEAKSIILLAIRAFEMPSRLGLSKGNLKVVALFGLHDPPRKEAGKVVAELTRQGIAIWMCTGDNTATARAVARSVGIDPEHVVAQALPNDKRALVQRLQGTSKRCVVTFCGDGISRLPLL